MDELDSMGWLRPWGRIENDETAKRFAAELHRETNPSHVLYEKVVQAIASSDTEDVLFEVSEASERYAVVHLTFSGKQDLHDNFPSTEFFESLQAFAQQRMKVDNQMLFPEDL